jgi:uncharacterized integral membrane protein
MDENEPKQEQVPVGENSEPASPEKESDEAWQPQLWSKLILLVVLVGYGIALVVANSSKVKISFLFASINVSKIWLILLCIVLGLVSGVLLSQMYRHRKFKRAQLERQAEQASKSLSR